MIQKEFCIIKLKSDIHQSVLISNNVKNMTLENWNAYFDIHLPTHHQI